MFAYMAGTLWIPGAERLKPSASGGTITSTAPPRVVWHTTEATPGTDSVWNAMIRVLTNKSAEPNVLYDPVTDRLGQWFPLNQSGRALRNDGANRTNRTGKVCIQIEVIGQSAKPFTDTWKPGKNFRALMAAIRSWGIPDVWPSGAPPKFIASPPHNVPEDERSRTIWASKGGHYGHSQIPGNDHGDPGGIDIKKLFAAGGSTSSKGLTVSEYTDLLAEVKKQGDSTRQEVRRQAIWTLRYGAQTEDEKSKADQAFDNAYNAYLAAHPGDIDGAMAAGQNASIAVMSPINADLAARALENG